MARNTRGFTLIEILLALAIFAIGFAMLTAVPSGAALLEKRYEQIVEGELATNNTVSLIGARRAFWPLYEYGAVSSGCTSGFCAIQARDSRSADSTHPYPGGADPLQSCEGPYIAGMGSNQLPQAYAWGSGSFGDTTGSGMLAPFVLFSPMESLSDSKKYPATRGHDADRQGDCEDFFCNPILTGLDAPDQGWGAGTQNLTYEPDLFKRVFDTNQSGLGEAAADNTFNSAPSANKNTTTPPLTNTNSALFSKSTWVYNEAFRWFSDYGDRTDFARAKIHFCHNRLMPALAYPIEIRSYPTTVPVAQRRQFISLGYVDNNLNASKRQWTLQAVAHAYNTADAWPEGAMGQDVTNASGSWPGAGGDPYDKAMMANGVGLFDSLATGFSIANWGTSSINTARNHGHVGACGWGWPSIVGAVRPLCGNQDQVQQFPTLMRLPAIIYDWNASQIQVAYPREYVPGVAGTAPGGAAGSDRRLKVGDHLLTAQAGLQMTVVDVRDESRPAYNGSTHGVDNHLYYQIVTVAPPLSTTQMGGPATTGAEDTTIDNQGHGANAYPYWRLGHIYIAPPPAGGTVSSWSWATAVSGRGFMSSNPNQ